MQQNMVINTQCITFILNKTSNLRRKGLYLNNAQNRAACLYKEKTIWSQTK